MLKNGSLTIMCEIIMPSYRLKDINLKEVEQEATVLSRLAALDIYEDLLNNSEFSDVYLICEGKTLEANKYILSKNSSVFAAMFGTEMKEKQENTFVINDIKYDVLVEMIRFVYTRKVKNIEILVGELATAADKYALEELKDMCEKTMRKNLSLHNVFVFLEIADKLRLDELKELSIEFIVENASDVAQKPEFQFLSADILRIIIYRGLVQKKPSNDLFSIIPPFS